VTIKESTAPALPYQVTVKLTVWLPTGKSYCNIAVFPNIAALLSIHNSQCCRQESAEAVPSKTAVPYRCRPQSFKIRSAPALACGSWWD